jgi:hypothetical protein
MGASFDLAGMITGGIGVSSILLGISNIIIYELWMKNGIVQGRAEKDYIDLLGKFVPMSDGIDAQTMQEFMDWEKQRRYDVEMNKCQKEIEVLENKLKKVSISEKAKGKICARIQWLKDFVPQIDMPYKVSEEIDELRLSTEDLVQREYKPNAVKKYLRRNRQTKYTFTATFSVVGLNILSFVLSASNIWQALFMTVLGAAALTASLVIGVHNGYNLITVVSTGVYKTAVDFINKAVGWCSAQNKCLYYKSDVIATPQEKVEMALAELALRTAAAREAFAEPLPKLEVE